MLADKEVSMSPFEVAAIPLLIAFLCGLINVAAAAALCIRIEKVFVLRTMILILLLEATCAFNFIALGISWASWIVANNSTP